MMRRANRSAAFGPLRDPAFRRIWASSLFSNLGQMILGTGAAWEMTRISGSVGMVALVQTALMLPSMLVAVPAGAIADMFDRRKVALSGLCFACSCSMLLTTLALLGYITPWLLLAFCSLIGMGVAIYSPAWQASVREQVPTEHLPAAIALTSISYNLARSFGPAIGGAIVLLAGSQAAFAGNALCYLPLITALFLWRRTPIPSRLPPERLHRAIVSGARYVRHSPTIRAVIFRALVTGMCGASVSALTPIIARDVLGGGAGTFGLLLGIYGFGAVGGALLISRVRNRLNAETSVRLCAAITGATIIVIGLSHNVVVTGVAMLIAGASWMLLVAMLNLGVQLSAPRWVTARALSWYQSSLTGGIATGAFIWGNIAVAHGISTALIVSGVALALTPLIGLLMPMPGGSSRDIEPIDPSLELKVGLAVTARSGPVVIEVDYEVAADQARNFYMAMLQVQRARLRNGAFDWSIMRDIADPTLWTERYQSPTWGDYLRQRSRLTQSDMALQETANAFRLTGRPARVRRMLERPFGSVRWRSDTPDPSGEEPLTVYTA